jgi:hypothetical protein
LVSKPLDQSFGVGFYNNPICGAATVPIGHGEAVGEAEV